MPESDAEKKDLERGAETQLIFECSVCQKVFDHLGMCPICNVLLKKQGG